MTPNAQKSICGCLLGTAVGDALGLPYEGLNPRRAARMFGAPNRHRFFFGRGMISDDTEHSCLAAQALLSSAGDTDSFRSKFASSLRWWILSLPAGVGKATAISLLKLCIGISPDRSGVFSAGNGPAMRAATLGVAVADLEELKTLVKISTRITHTDPKAEWGALAIALAAHMASSTDAISPASYLELLESQLDGAAEEFTELIQQVVRSVENRQSTLEFSASIGAAKGVSGYVFQTVPVCIHAWLSFPSDYESAVSTIICCGGDADTTAAIVGGIVGASVGESGIPAEWIENLKDWPRSVSWIRTLGASLAASTEDADSSPVPRTAYWKTVLRNLFFLIVVLFHGFRRLFPPY